MVITRAQGRIVFANESLKRFTEGKGIFPLANAEGLWSENIRSLLGLPLPPELLPLARVLRGPFTRYEVMLFEFKGGHRRVSVGGAPIPNIQGAIVMVQEMRSSRGRKSLAMSSYIWSPMSCPRP